MILTITLNPCIDKSTATDKFIPETKLRCTEVIHEPGGGGINVSKALQRLGEASVAIFPSGGHNGDMLKSLLRAEGVEFSAVNTDAETRENWVVLDTDSNNQYRFTFPGRSIPETSIHELIARIKQFTPSHIVASGSLPPGLPDYFYGMIADTANIIGAKCIVDTSGPALQAIKSRNVYLLKPNVAELCKMLAIDKLDKNEVDDAAQQAVMDGFSEIMVVSMGASGAWLVSKDEKYFSAAPLVDKKSTVGAGDSMVAGLVYQLHKGANLEQALEFGVACGTAATMNEGTQLFKIEDAYHLYDLIHKIF